MAGNSQRRGAVRKDGTKKGPTVGSGGVRRRGLEGRGATPPAQERPHHPAAKRAAEGAPSSSSGRRSKKTDDTEMVLGRNPVLECLRAGVPATALYVALGTESDERLTESVTRAADSGIAILEVPRIDLDRMSTNGLHQGIALQVPPYDYAHPDDMLKSAHRRQSTPALLVALDNISDPRNLGRDRAFGGGVRRTRRGDPAAAVGLGHRGGVAHQRGCGGAASGGAGDESQSHAEELGRRRPAGRRARRRGRHRARRARRAPGPIVVVVGSEGKGLSRLVRENCDAIVSIPMAGPTESLNASVAAGVVLAEIARQRRG